MLNNFFESLKSGDTDAILILCWCLLRFALGIVEVIAARCGLKLNKKSKQEESSMKIKYYTEQERPPFKPTEFTRFIPEWKLDEKTGELKQTGGKIDVQEMVESYADCALAKVLDKFLPENVSKVVAQYGEPTDEQFGEAAYKDDLKDLSDLYEQAEVYREKYNLGDDLSATQVFDYVNNLASQNAAYLTGLAKGSETVAPKEEKLPTYEELLAAYKEAQK